MNNNLNNIFDLNNLGKTIKSETLVTTPDGGALLHGIAGNFSRLAEVLEELIDNVVSNLKAHDSDASLSRVILIGIDHNGSSVDISIQDGGTGIEDLGAALSIANGKGDTVLNEHGFGLKHALASVDASPNQMWTIRTRTKLDAENNRYREVSSPYGINTMTCVTKPGCAEFGTGTGTKVMFRCPLTMYNTLRPKDSAVEPTFEEMVGFLIEDLQYTYAPMLKAKLFMIRITAAKNGVTKVYDVNTPMEPNWLKKTVRELPAVTKDLGSGVPLTIRCKYGEITPTHGAVRHYLCNMETSGVEIRANGRTIENNIFHEIWGKKMHPAYNHLIVQVDLEYDNIEAAPSTRSSKNGFRAGDPRLDELFRWIKTNVELPPQDKEGKEDKLKAALKRKLDAKENVMRASREVCAYETIGLKTAVDLFVSYKDDSVHIYEAKAGVSKPDDVYQTLMYWDGCVRDGKPADKAILIAKSHPKQVVALTEEVNRHYDVRGKHYSIELQTWSEAGITGSKKNRCAKAA